MWNLSITLYDCWDQVGVACLFLNGGLLFCDRGGIFNSFFTSSSSLFFLLCFFSVLQRWPGVRAQVKG